MTKAELIKALQDDPSPDDTEACNAHELPFKDENGKDILIHTRIDSIRCVEYNGFEGNLSKKQVIILY